MRGVREWPRIGWSISRAARVPGGPAAFPVLDAVTERCGVRYALSAFLVFDARHEQMRLLRGLLQRDIEHIERMESAA